MFSHRGLGWVSWTQKAISTSSRAGRKAKLVVGKGGPREQEKLEPVPVPAMQLSPTKWHFLVARTGSQVPKNCRLKSIYSTKFWGDQKLGWVWRACCMVIQTIWRCPVLFWPFFNFFLTLYFTFQNEGPFLHEQRGLFSPETFGKGHPLPTVREKLNLTPPFLRELPRIDVSFKKCRLVLHRAYLILCLGRLHFVTGWDRTRVVIWEEKYVLLCGRRSSNQMAT